jgi:hypothetical protein
MKKYQFDQSPQLIRPPKYSGITLSLLSLFVLVCMLAVWEKMPKEDFEQPLVVCVPKKAEGVLRNAVNGFERETGASLILNFDSLPSEKEKPPSGDNPPDLFIFENDPNSDSTSHAKEGTKENMVWLAYQAVTSGSGEALIASVPETCKNSVLAFQFARYLSAPTRGQFDFANAGWTGVDGDRWSITPEIKVWISDGLGQDIHHLLTTFEKREGAKIIPETFSGESLLKALEIAGNSESKKFLPDVVYVHDKKQNDKFSDLSFRAFHDSLSPRFANFQIYLNLWSKLPNISERLALHSINAVKESEL